MAVNVSQLADLVNWTRATEYQKGSYTSLTEPLPEYPLYNMLLPREVLDSTPTIRYQAIVNRNNSFRVTQVGEPLQVTVPKLSRTISTNWSKVQTAWAYYTDEEAFNGSDEDRIIDVILARKAEHDAEMRRNLEIKFNDSANEPEKTDIIGLKDWLPAKTTATDLELNGGADVGYGISGISVADVPRWGHAVCGFDKLSDDDLFRKLSEFMHRSKYYVPEGSRQVDPSSPNRCILANHAVFTAWEELQTVANDDLRNDLGLWRGAINFRSVPVKINHAQSEPDSPATPAGHALLYMLDLNTWHLWIHKDYNFVLSPPHTDGKVPGEVTQYRDLYCQLACTNREKNLVAYSTTPEFVIS